VRLYFQEIDANGNHLSWNVMEGDLQSGTSTYQHTVRAGRRLTLRIDKTNTHLNETTNFYVDQVTVTKQ